MSKTPTFDAALDAIFATLVPHERICKECATPFLIEEGDIEFLRKLRVPPPTLCPRCRLQRRLAYRSNIRPVFYKKLCAVPGHAEKVITTYDDDNPTLVYDDAFYRGDAWDPLRFGRVWNPDAPFFEQYSVFEQSMPHQPLQRDPQGVNSDYTLGGFATKNCYWVAVPYHAEDVQYGFTAARSKDSIDFSDLADSEQCYSCALVERLYNCVSCVNSSDCVDSFFLYDCKNCSNCFGCTNLRNKKYCFFNEQLTKEEYEKRMAEIDLGSFSVFESYRSRFQTIVDTAIRKNLDNLKNENSSGNQLRQCKNCIQTFRILGGGENLRYVVFADKITDSMDHWGGVDLSLMYESIGVAGCAGGKFSQTIRTGREVEYSGECSNVEYVFGCFGLRNKKYCIFNTQYSEEEYWPKVDEIKTSMLARGEYGEFFPTKMSPLPYNDSNAQVEFPLTKDAAIARGWKWHDEKKSGFDLNAPNVVRAADLPDNIRDVADDMLEKVIVCAETGRPFRLTQFELDFYRKHKVPIPRLHPDVRIKKLLEYRLPYRLFDDACKKCGKAIKSGYDPAKNYAVYCEQCYNSEVI